MNAFYLKVIQVKSIAIKLAGLVLACLLSFVISLAIS